MVTVVVDRISPRIRYTFKQVFELFLRIEYSIVEVADHKHTGFVLNYTSDSSLKAHLQIIPHGILSQDSIENFIPPVEGEKDEVKLFVNTSPIFGFDVFAATFWMLARYEEYCTVQLDDHGRFPAKESVAYKYKFLSFPVIDLWMKELGRLLELNGVHVPAKQFSVTNTIDVDNAFAYKGKSGIRKIGAFSRDLLKGKFAENKKRNNVLKGDENDPYDTYAYIKEQTASKNIQTIFFHLVGEVAKHDRNISLDSTEYKKLIKELSVWSVQGIHPSYASNAISGRVKDECRKLSSVTGKTVEYSRQHFLKLKFPNTYRSLIDADIKHDHTMGYADEIGFRAGTARAFTFFDLNDNCEKPLTIHPFCLMDGTLHDYLKLTPVEAKILVEKMIERLKGLHLPYIAIWHNETLSETRGWEGWREVYEAQFS